MARDLKRLYDLYWRRLKPRRSQLLLDLVDLENHQCQYFWARWGSVFAKASDQELLKWRDELRQVWEDAPQAGEILDHWMAHQPTTFASLYEKRWLVLRGLGLRFPNPRNLPLMLALSVEELGWKLAICENLNCPDRYFIRSKVKQRFCGLRECVKVAQKEHKRRSWHRHKGEWRPPGKASKRKRRAKRSRERGG